MKSIPWSMYWLAAVVMAASVCPAPADLFWQGTGDWNTNNWATTSGGTYNQPWTAGSNAWFETTAGTITVDAATSVGNMTFSVAQNVAGSAPLTLNGTTITGGLGFLSTISATLTGNSTLTTGGAGPVVLTGANNYTGLTTISSGALIIGNDAALGTTDAGTTVASGAALRLQGGITVAGEELTLTGTGTGGTGALRNLNGGNTWAGPIATAGGQVNVQSDAGLLTLAGPIGLHGLSTQYNLVLVPKAGGNILVTGDITGGVDGSTADRRSVTLGSASTGVVTLSGTNTYLGRTSINGGTLRVQGGSAIPDASMVLFGNNTLLELNNDETVGSLTGGATATIKVDTNTLTVGAANNSTEAVFSGVIQGTGSIIKTGSGVQTLSGANTYNGETLVNAGVLRISHDTALGTPASGTTVAAGASLQLQGGITVAGESLSVIGDGVHYATDPGALRNISGNNTWTGPITIGSSLTRVASDSGTLALEGNIALSGSAANHLVLQGNGNITITGNISGGGSGQTLTRSGVGSGVMTLAGTNTYGGITTITGGTLAVSGGSAIPDGSRVYFSSGSGTPTFELLSSETIGSLSSVGANARVVLNGNTLTIADGGSQSFLGTVSGTGGVTKAGTGTQVFSGANTYSGGTAVNGGILRISHAQALGTTDGGTSVSSGAALHLEGGITVAGEALALAGVGYNYGGALRNLSGNNTWTGPITTSGGQVNVPCSAGLLTLSGPITLAASDTQYNLVLIPTTNGNIVVSGDISGGFDGTLLDRRSVTLGSASTGVATLSGTNTYLGRTSINGGTLRVEGGSAIPDASRVNLSGGGTLELGNDETIGSLLGVAGTTVNLNANTLSVGADNDPVLQNFTGAITGTGGLTKVGTGIQALTGTNTYTGDTIIEQGILHIGSTGSIDPASAIKLAKDGTHRVVVLADGGGASAGSRRSQLHSPAGNTVQLPAAITAVASTATSLVDMQWRARTAAEQSRQLSSDVLTLTNTFPTTAQAFVLQMAYDPALPWIAGRESELIGDELIYLASDVSGNWENAVFGNTSGSPLWMGDTAAPSSDLAAKLGWHGVDTSGAAHVAWAVLNYGGSFSVVGIPEPGTLALLAAGLLVFVCPRRKRK